jgi:hypothetical protein
VNPNQWGVTEDSATNGALCMNVSLLLFAVGCNDH